MKKIYSLILGLACAITASAATPQFFDEDGNNIANGSTLTISELKAPLSIPGKGTKYQFDSGMQVSGSQKGQLTIHCAVTKATDPSNAGFEAQLCIGGGCITPNDNNVMERTYEYLTADYKEELQLHYNIGNFLSYEPTGTLEATVSAYYAATPSEKVTVYLVMSNEGAGVNDVIANGSSVSFANNTLSYNINGSSTLQVYDLTGKVVRATKVSGNGQADLGTLAPGLYICRIADKTTKVLVK